MSKYIAAFALVLVAGFGIVGIAPISVSAASSTASSTPAHGNGSSPYYFFHELGIQTTIEAADAVWQMDNVREVVMSLWRQKAFGIK